MTTTSISLRLPVVGVCGLMRGQGLVLVVLLVSSVLLLNIALGLFHVSTLMTVSVPRVYLKHELRPLQSSAAATVESHAAHVHSDWIEKLYLALSDEVLLTRNIKSKEHLWKGIEQSDHFHKESGQILVFLGWVAYWVRYRLEE
jgi:hypothetical protein